MLSSLCMRKLQPSTTLSSLWKKKVSFFTNNQGFKSFPVPTITHSLTVYELQLPTMLSSLCMRELQPSTMLSSLWRRGTSLLSRRSVYRLADFDDYDDQFSSTIVDWREKRALLPVANQTEGTCYASAAIDVVASAHHIYGRGKLPRLSAEELIDNTPVYEDGGDICESFEYMKSCGISLEKKYHFSRSKKDFVLRPRIRIEGYACIASGQEPEMVRILSGYHPIAVSVVHSNSLNHYERGIYKPPRYLYGKNIRLIQGQPDFPKDTSFHSMTVVAAGIYHGRNVWLLKNNWGEEWGMGGFIFLPRDGTFAGCLGINLYPTFPLVGPPERYELNSNKYVYWDY